MDTECADLHELIAMLEEDMAREREAHESADLKLEEEVGKEMGRVAHRWGRGRSSRHERES